MKENIKMIKKTKKENEKKNYECPKGTQQIYSKL